MFIYRNDISDIVDSNSLNSATNLFNFQVIPVDLFPHTKHFELVILFERVSAKETDEAQADQIKQEPLGIKVESGSTSEKDASNGAGSTI